MISINGLNGSPFVPLFVENLRKKARYEAHETPPAGYKRLEGARMGSPPSLGSACVLNPLPMGCTTSQHNMARDPMATIGYGTAPMRFYIRQLWKATGWWWRNAVGYRWRSDPSGVQSGWAIGSPRRAISILACPTPHMIIFPVLTVSPSSFLPSS
jgi:hypothetical protein